jgi:hypothetical protein
MVQLSLDISSTAPARVLPQPPAGTAPACSCPSQTSAVATVSTDPAVLPAHALAPSATRSRDLTRRPDAAAPSLACHFPMLTKEFS